MREDHPSCYKLAQKEPSHVATGKAAGAALRPTMAAPAGAPAFGSYETAPAAAPRPTSDAEYEYSEYTYSPPSDMPPAAR